MARRRNDRRNDRPDDRRGGTGVTNFLSEIVDDVKVFVDEDVLDRSRDAERNVRRAARNWTDSGDGGLSRPDRDGGDRNEEIDELRRAIRSLAEKINALSGSGSGVPIADYDDLTAVEIGNRLTSLSQADLRKADEYERSHANRTAVLARIRMLREGDPGIDAVGVTT